MGNDIKNAAHLLKLNEFAAKTAQKADSSGWLSATRSQAPKAEAVAVAEEAAAMRGFDDLGFISFNDLIAATQDGQ